jgi:hypothetical protein
MNIYNLQEIILLISVILVIILIFLKWQQAKAILFALMLQAKRYAKDSILNSGKEQEDWVIKQAMKFLPISFKLLVPEEMIRIIVIRLYKSLKDYLDDGIINNSNSK